MKSCNSGRERWSGNSCPNSVDRRGTDKPWSEHQEGIKVEKNNREMNVWVDSEYRLCEKFSSDYEVGLEVSFTLLAYW